MAYFNFYPYTNFHELNADWVIAELKRLSAELDSALEEAVSTAVDQSKAYTDEQLSGYQDQITQLRLEFDEVKATAERLETDFGSFTSEVENKLNYFESLINANTAAINARTDAAIKANNNMLLETMATNLGNIKVVNFFTGALTTIQEMFNYLCMLHISDSIDYNTMASRAKTYAELVSLNVNYENLIAHGNTLYV